VDQSLHPSVELTLPPKSGPIRQTHLGRNVSPQPVSSDTGCFFILISIYIGDMKNVTSFAVGLLVLGALLASSTAAAELRTVGVLGNTAGMSDRPVPYAYYAGIGVDTRGR